MEAQSIKTAPKDGRRVLLFGVCEGHVTLNPTEPIWVTARWRESEWVVDPIDYYDIAVTPTHWMQIPDGPAGPLASTTE